MTRLALFAAALVVAGCTTSDPGRGGFFGGVGGLVSGSYDRRVQTYQSHLTQEQVRRQSLERQAEHLASARAATAADLAEAEARLNALDRDMAALYRRLDEAEAERRASEDEILRLRRELDDLEGQIRLAESNPVMGATAKRAELDRLRARKQALEDALDAALGG